MWVIFNRHFPLGEVMNSCDPGKGSAFSPPAALKFPGEINNASDRLGPAAGKQGDSSTALARDISTD